MIENEEIINERIMIAVVKESGEVTWITANEPTKNQHKQFQKMFAVTHNPSFIISIILFIEIMIMKLIYTFEESKEEEK